VIRDQDSQAALLQVRDHALQIRARDRVDAREGLVEEDERRAGGQRPRDLDAPPLPP